jgi:hypothetical protein
MPQLYWIVPLEPGHAGNELPGGPPGHVGGGPIYHPGHPSHGLPSHGHVGGGPIYHPGHPDHGLPSHGGPVDPGYGQVGGQPHPGNRPPGSWWGRDRIDNSLPEGEDVEISNELPEVPSEYEDKVVVAIKRPNQEWTVKAYDPNSGIDNTLPPAPEPK